LPGRWIHGGWFLNHVTNHGLQRLDVDVYRPLRFCRRDFFRTTTSQQATADCNYEQTFFQARLHDGNSRDIR
jgi:hypothetical protein